MSKFPFRKIKVGYRWFKIRDIDSTQVSSLGTTNRMEGVIGLNSRDGQDAEEFANTVVHEILHAITKVNDDEGLFKDAEAYESFTTRAANTLVLFIQENAAVIDWVKSESLAGKEVG
jgi:hypothetical protein